MIRKYIKLCPECNKEQIYASKKMLNSSIKNNSLCYSCSNKKRGKNIKQILYLRTSKKKTYERKCSNPTSNLKCRKSILYINKHNYLAAIRENTVCTNCLAIKGSKKGIETKRRNGNQRLSLETRKKISAALSGKKHYFYGKKHTEETKRKIGLKSSERIIKRREKSNINTVPNYNINACKIIEEYGKKHKYNFQHALNGGEVRIIKYWVDGYDKEKNVVIEYDERYHYDINDCLSENDVVRQNDIIDRIKCKFIRIKFNGEISVFE